MKLIDQLRAAVASPRKRLHAHGLAQGAEAAAQKVRPLLQNVVAFRLSDDVVEAACRLALDHPDILAELSRRARLPYPVCFFEWSNHHKIRVCGGTIQDGAPLLTGSLARREPDDSMFSFTNVSQSETRADTGKLIDHGIGFSAFTDLFSPDRDLGSHGGELLAFLRRTLLDEGKVVIKSPHGEFSQASVLRSIIPDGINEPDYQHLLMIMYLYGNIPWGGHNYREAPMEWDAARSLSRRLSIRFNDFEARTIRESLRSDEVLAQLQMSYRENLGDAKLMIAALSLINANDRIVDASLEPGNGSTYVGHRFIKYLDQRVIHLKLPFRQCQRTLRAMAFRMRKRRHGVLGHWCSSHRVGDPGCPHKYDDVDPKHKVCSLCQHRIWYRPEHMRGDASIGFVRQSYEVERRAT